MKRPNFLFIITDQQRADHLGCYGNTVLRTPHIDALAAQGVRMQRHYVAMPICMPNRATLVTGRMPSLHGVRHNGIELPLNSVTMPELLADAGYQTALVGKSHLQNFTSMAPQYGPGAASSTGGEAPPARRPEATPGHGQEDPANWSDPGYHVSLPYYGFQSVDLVTRHGDRCGGDYLRWAQSQDPEFLHRIGRDNALPAPGYDTHEGWRTRVPESLYSTTYVADRSIDRLRAFSEQPDKPFFLYCSFPDPHHPWTPPGRYWGMYQPEDIPLNPAYWGDAKAPWEASQRTGLPHLDHYRDLRDRAAAAKAAGYSATNVTATYACSAREAQEAASLTYCSLAMIDDAVGRITAELRRLGLDLDTVIVFTSDHGDYMGDHQLMLKSSMHFQGLVRTPFIWADAALGAQAGGARTQLTGAIDVARSILTRAEVAPADGMQGLDLNPLLHDRAVSTRDALLIEDEDHRTPAWLGVRSRTRTLVTDRHRLSVYGATGWGELYDLDEDPHELRNLWDEPAAGPLRGELTEGLLRAMLDNFDTLPKPTRFA